MIRPIAPQQKRRIALPCLPPVAVSARRAASDSGAG